MNPRNLKRKEPGFTVLEICVVLAASLALVGAAVPVLNTVLNQYRLTLAAQNITTQLQFARMKAVSSNESFRLNFPAGQRFYQVETAAGDVISGPFFLPPGINLNAIDTGQDVTFGGRFVSFSATGDAAAVGNGSAGRVKIINQLGGRIDILVGTAGIVRQTPAYRNPPAPF